MRGIPAGQPAISPPTFADLHSPDDFRRLADQVRELTGGIPIGFKMSANHIEADIDFALAAGVDYLILDGRGGAREVGWDAVEGWTADQGLLWLHLDYEGNALDLLDSVLSNLGKAPHGLLWNIAAYSKTAEDGFSPEAVIAMRPSVSLALKLPPVPPTRPRS